MSRCSIASVDLDLRLVRAFSVVAEELHFGRAANRLHIAQPALSRQIQRLERLLEVKLVSRTTRTVELTPAGDSFLVHGRRLLAAGERASGAAKQISGGRISIGFSAGLTVSSAVASLRRTFPHADVELKHVEWFEQHDAVRDGIIDVCIGRLPIGGSEVEVLPLYDEPRVALLPVGHRLAGKESVSILDLADEPIARHEGAASWDAFWRVDPRPDGRPAPDGPVVASIEEKMEYVANGDCISIVPASASVGYRRDGVQGVPIDDIPQAIVAAITRREPHSEMIEAFICALQRST